MKAVLQRVNHAEVIIDNKVVAKIQRGLLILLGIAPDDTQEIAKTLADKIATLRIFEDENEKMNLSCLDIQGKAIVVSQFTLFADTSRGRRPSFIGAAKPEIAEPLCEFFVHELARMGIPTQSGIFGANMRIRLENDGPVTINIDIS